MQTVKDSSDFLIDVQVVSLPVRWYDHRVSEVEVSSRQFEDYFAYSEAEQDSISGFIAKKERFSD